MSSMFLLCSSVCLVFRSSIVILDECSGIGIIFWIVLVFFVLFLVLVLVLVLVCLFHVCSGMFVPSCSGMFAFSFAQFSSSHFLFWFFPRQTDSLILR